MKILNRRQADNPDKLVFLATQDTTTTTMHMTKQMEETVTPIPHPSIPTLPTLDVNRLGVPQPSLATKDILIIIFMLLLWAYSLFLTYKAWYKLLYSDSGEERSNMWR